MNQITKQHIDFVNAAALEFNDNPIRETFMSEQEYPGYIALRMGDDRDCVEVYELGEGIANFVQVIPIQPRLYKSQEKFLLHTAKLQQVNGFKEDFLKGQIFSIFEKAQRLESKKLEPKDCKELLDDVNDLAYIIAIALELGASIMDVLEVKKYED